jgi:phospholipase C
MLWKRYLLAAGALALGLVPAVSAADQGQDPAAAARTATAIKHVVVIFQENVSFDHYFATYPDAANTTKGEPVFRAADGTPNVNGLDGALLTSNPNQGNPQRLSRAQALTCDQGHGYTQEQQAMDFGALDMFVQKTGGGLTLAQCLAAVGNTTPAGPVNPNFAVMDYYDGNSVTALWNYAQRFSMSDNSFGTGYGPSSPGAINLIGGNTFGAICGGNNTINAPKCTGPFSTANTPGVSAPQGAGTVFGDDRPLFDNCNTGQSIAEMGGKNVGDLLNAQGLTWGWFQGGFADCKHDSHQNIGGATVGDYIMHHEPFQYYPQTSNPLHLPPTSNAMIGHQDQANHQYDLSAFFTAADAGHMPAVSFLKAAAFQDGHAGYSDPLDEQTFLVDTINHLQRLDSWRSTAVIIAYDDSDGWYDHVEGPLVSQSQVGAIDALTAAGQCGSSAAKVPSGQQGRCGYGTRQPLLLISPFSRTNFVDHTLTDQSSITRFIEDNWHLGRLGGGSADAFAGTLTNMFDFDRPQASRFILDPSTGQRLGDDGNEG